MPCLTTLGYDPVVWRYAILNNGLERLEAGRAPLRSSGRWYQAPTYTKVQAIRYFNRILSLSLFS
jgi:hypothetical protein